MPQTARTHFHPGHLDVRMHAQWRLVAVESVEQGILNELGLCQHCRQCRIGMPLGQHEAITIRPVRLLRSHVQDVEIQRGQEVRGRYRATHVTTPRGMQGPPHITAYLECFDLQTFQQVCACCCHSTPL